MRPEGYRETCIVTRDIPYSVAAGQSEGTQNSSGTLLVGRVVWTQRKPAIWEEDRTVSAFVEEVGIIDIDPTYLQAA